MSKRPDYLFQMISPVDYRYLAKKLQPYLSEEAFVQEKLNVEAALAKVKVRRGIISQKAADEIVNACRNGGIKASEVYEEEDKTHHDIIALVNRIKSRISKESKPGVHSPATSFDIVDTANVRRYKNALNEVIIPSMISYGKALVDLTRIEKDTPQIGRTHLQHAEPITFGFANAWYLDRWGKRIMKMKEETDALEAKFSGAVGAYNATSLFVDDPVEFEREVLAELDLKPNDISTQIMQPEHVTDVMGCVTTSFGILANWADDMRNLERPEIAEIGQPRGKDISRSSTMPNKANPVGLENIKSMYKAFMPFMVTMYMDQISDHQRDLTNSASQRFVPQMLNMFEYSVERADRIAKKIKPHPKNMLKNLKLNADKVIAEPLHLMLSSYGHPNAHEYVGKMADKSYVDGIPLTEIVLKDKSLKPYLEKFTSKQFEVIEDPLKYMGIASKKAEDIANKWEKIFEKI